MRRWHLPLPRALATLGLSAALLLPGAAHAQFGGLLKKAKKTVSGDAASTSSGGNGRPSSTFGPELTAESFAAVMKGLNAELAPKQQRDALARQADEAIKTRNGLLDAHQAEYDAYQKAANDHMQCTNAAFDQIDNEHQAAAKKKQQEILSTPGGVEKMQNETMALTQQMMALMQKGDTAGAQRLQMAFAQKQMGLDPKADTAAVEKQCGKEPAKPAWLERADAAYARADTLNRQVTRLEQTIGTRGVQASGMSAVAYNLARERILNWYFGGASHTGVQQFGADELRMLDAHEADIKRVAEVFQ